MNGRVLVGLGVSLTLAGIIAFGASSVLEGAQGTSIAPTLSGLGMMGGAGMIRGASTGLSPAPGPGESGFVAGTPSAPRLVRVLATPVLRFLPGVVPVQAGETVTFEVTAMGPIVHEFMVGPAADVAANKDGTAEVADIGMMQTKALTYTFSGSGPFAFACHAPGHYEAGMTGTIVVD